MDSIFLAEKPFSLLNMSNVAGASVPVISRDVITNSSDGSTPSRYSLSSAFCHGKINHFVNFLNHQSFMTKNIVGVNFMGKIPDGPRFANPKHM